MAAQEYYNAAPGGYSQSPASQNSIPSHTSNGPPPPYSIMSQPPTSQPQYPEPKPPQQQQQQQPYPPQPQYNGQQNGPPRQSTPYGYNQYPPQQQPAQNYYTNPYPYPPNGYNTQQQYNQYPQQGYAAQHQQAVRPHSQPPTRPSGSSHSPYRPSSRSRSRHRHHRHQSSERHHESSRSGGKKGRFDTFVGAGGGAIIGDAIFPGLGTVGGALLGGLGGHKVAREKRRSQDDDKYRRGRSGSTSHREYHDDYDDRQGRRRY